MCMQCIFVVILYFLYCHNNEPCTLHSLDVRLISYLSCSQSPVTFTISSAYRPALPALRFTTPPPARNHRKVSVPHFEILWGVRRCELGITVVALPWFTLQSASRLVHITQTELKWCSNWKLQSIEDRGQTDRVTTPTRAGLRRCRSQIDIVTHRQTLITIHWVK